MPPPLIMSQPLVFVHVAPLAPVQLHPVALAEAGLPATAATFQSAHVIGGLHFLVVPLHEPLVQSESFTQVLPVVQLAVKTQPLAGLQESVVHGLLSLHVTVVPLHVPLVQVSGEVQELPSAQDVPLLTLTLVQPVPTAPPAPMQASVVQLLPSLQVPAVPVHAPAWQLSPVVHE